MAYSRQLIANSSEKIHEARLSRRDFLFGFAGSEEHHTQCWYQIWYDGGMSNRKITIEVPAALLEQAQKATGTGITQTIRWGLQIVAASEAYSQARKLRGKHRFSISVERMKDD